MMPLLRTAGVPLLIALLPLLAFAILQFTLPVVAPKMMADAGVKSEAYGWIGGAFGLGSLTLFVCNHAILPCCGPLRTLAFGLALGIVGGALMLTGWMPAMIVGGFLIGFGYATTTPAGSQVLADFTDRAVWGTLFSLRQAAVPIGGVLAGLMAAQFVATSGWRTSIEAALALCLAAAVILVALPARFNASRPLQSFDIAALVSPLNLRRPFTIVSSIAGLPSLALVGIGLAFVHSAVTSFFVIYMSAGNGIALRDAAMLFALLQFCAIVGRIGFGMLADRLGSPLPVLKLLAPLSASSALLLSVFSPDWSQLVRIATVMAMGLTVGTWNGLHLAEIARLAPVDRVGEATAGTAFFTFISYMICPPVVAWLAVTVGYPATMRWVSLAALFAGTVLWLRERPAWLKLLR